MDEEKKKGEMYCGYWYRDTSHYRLKFLDNNNWSIHISLNVLILLGDSSLEMRLLMPEEATVISMTSHIAEFISYLNVSNECINVCLFVFSTFYKQTVTFLLHYN